MAISTINEYVYIGILNNFLISSIENWFGVEEVIFGIVSLREED